MHSTLGLAQWWRRRGFYDMTGQDRDWDKTLEMEQTEPSWHEQGFEDAGCGCWHRAWT